MFGPFKHHLAHPNLWAINRRSVAGGVAAGLFCGLIPGPFQILVSVLWVFLAKVNLPVAVLTTLYTNPLTIVPLYIFAVAYGHLLMGSVGSQSTVDIPHWDWSDWGGSTHALFDWTLSLGPSLAVGLPATMVTFAVLGYGMVRLLWNLGVRIVVVRRRKRVF